MTPQPDRKALASAVASRNYVRSRFAEEHRERIDRLWPPRGLYARPQKPAQPKRPVGRPRKPPPPPVYSDQAIAAFKDMVGTTRLTLRVIMHAVCIVTNVPASEFLAPPKGTKKVTDARQVYYFLAREILKRSYPEIGNRCGRDHTSVLHGYKKIKANLAKYADDISAAKKLLGVE